MPLSGRRWRCSPERGCLAHIVVRRASGAHCTATCRENGRCNALVKVLRDVQAKRVVCCGHRVEGFDAVTAGDVCVARPAIFEVLRVLASQSLYCSTADALAELARRGSLSYIEVGPQLHWFGSRTVTAVFRNQDVGLERGKQGAGWQHVVRAAQRLMQQRSDDVDLPPDAPTRRPWPETRMLLPLLKMGEQIGQGANCQVLAASLGQMETSQAMGWPKAMERRASHSGISTSAGVPRRLAVKIYETGHSADRGAKVMREVMWEVHVLRQIQHPHITRFCDTIEFTDAVYIVMERCPTLLQCSPALTHTAARSGATRGPCHRPVRLPGCLLAQAGGRYAGVTSQPLRPTHRSRWPSFTHGFPRLPPVHPPRTQPQPPRRLAGTKAPSCRTFCVLSRAARSASRPRAPSSATSSLPSATRTRAAFYTVTSSPPTCDSTPRASMPSWLTGAWRAPSTRATARASPRARRRTPVRSS